MSSCYISGLPWTDWNDSGSRWALQQNDTVYSCALIHGIHVFVLCSGFNLLGLLLARAKCTWESYMWDWWPDMSFCEQASAFSCSLSMSWFGWICCWSVVCYTLQSAGQCTLMHFIHVCIGLCSWYSGLSQPSILMWQAGYHRHTYITWVHYVSSMSRDLILSNSTQLVVYITRTSLRVDVSLWRTILVQTGSLERNMSG